MTQLYPQIVVSNAKAKNGRHCPGKSFNKMLCHPPSFIAAAVLFKSRNELTSLIRPEAPTSIGYDIFHYFFTQSVIWRATCFKRIFKIQGENGSRY